MDQIQSLLDAHPAIFLAMLIWVLAWKGWALWIAAGQGSKKWFVALLVLNTLGVLEILYIYVFSKKKSDTVKKDSEIVLEIESSE